MHRITIQYGAPADPAAFDQHYADVHMPLARSCRACAASWGPIRGASAATRRTSSPSCGSTTPTRSRRR